MINAGTFQKYKECLHDPKISEWIEHSNYPTLSSPKSIKRNYACAISKTYPEIIAFYHAQIFKFGRIQFSINNYLNC